MRALVPLPYGLLMPVVAQCILRSCLPIRPSECTMTTVQLTLNIPDSLAQAATQAGLLKPEAIEYMLREALRRQDIDGFFAAADQLATVDIPPMSLEEIQAEVNAVRATRKADRLP